MRTKKLNRLPCRIREVAEHAGVSKSTVSRVLNRSALVDPDTRRRVLEAAQRLNYYRSASARHLARGGKSDFFGLLISDIENPVFPEMIKGFETAAAAMGYGLFLCTTNYSSDRAESAVRKMIENGVRGVAVMTSSLSEEIALPLAARDIGVVMVDLEVPRRHLSSLVIDYESGLAEAVEHLVQLGHEGGVFVAGSDDRRSARRYREAVLRALRGKKLKLQHIIECDQTLEGGRAAVRRLTGIEPAPTALICINDLTAIGAMSGLREMGLNVPRDVSVVGCEDIYLSRFVDPPLTTVKFDRKALGRAAFEALERMSRTKVGKGIRTQVPTQLMVRSSTAAKTAAARAWLPAR